MCSTLRTGAEPAQRQWDEAACGASPHGESAAQHGCRSGNQVGVSLSLSAVRQNWGVLEPGPDAVAAGDSALVDRPRGDAVAVVHLFQGDAGLVKGVLDGFGVRE